MEYCTVILCNGLNPWVPEACQWDKQMTWGTHIRYTPRICRIYVIPCVTLVDQPTQTDQGIFTQ